uniref:Uncharacterized protein n=1 Tax=Ananas comosus var. bracteatus TaxID=296719 RepID=A0A6V7PY45_ANACO|nr:unnamed protein product [Ananas comosus var. bracteatus]
MNLQWFLPEASSNHVSNPEELEARLDRELIRIVLFFSLFYSTHTHVEGPTLSALHLLSKFRISCPSPSSLHPSSAIGNGRSLNLTLLPCHGDGVAPTSIGPWFDLLMRIEVLCAGVSSK